jgi:hypothetical protein
MTRSPWNFDIAPDAVVVTTRYVTEQGLPVLYVTHEHDPEEGIVWQFHAGNGDYSSAVLQLVRLDEILAIDPNLSCLWSLPVGQTAARESAANEWVFHVGSA